MTTAPTEAEAIQKEFGGDSVVELINVSKAEASDFTRFEYIIIGGPTWNIGQLESDWEAFYDELDNIDFTGKRVAYLALETKLVILIALKMQSAF